MDDLRLPENRRETFLRLWALHQDLKAHPGGVYSFLPAIAEHYALTQDGRAWLVWLNGNTQNPVTSLLLLEASGFSPTGWRKAVDFWNDNFKALQWDMDRRHQKGKFGEATETVFKTQGAFTGGWYSAARRGWDAVWSFANGQPYMGRLSAWSMTEYARILFGPVIPDATTLLLNDPSGSRSHRAGLAMVDGAPMEGAYWGWEETKDMMVDLALLGEDLLAEMKRRRPHDWTVSRLTLESALCTFKSTHKPNRRYPNVYSDMAYERLMAGEARFGKRFDVLWKARQRDLPEWARLEDNPADPGLSPVKQNHYRETGQQVMLGHVWPEYWSEFDEMVVLGGYGTRKDKRWT